MTDDPRHAGADGEDDAGVSGGASGLEGTELETAIAENPDAVAAFVRRLDVVTELLDVVALGEDALTDEMIVERADTGSTLAESADAVGTDATSTLAGAVGENDDDLGEALETLVELQHSGTLDDLAELAGIASLATDALDDEMVRSLAATGGSLGEVADTAAAPGTRDGIETLLDGVGAAERAEPDAVGAIGLVRALRDPEVKYGLGYMLAMASAIGRSSTANTPQR